MRSNYLSIALILSSFGGISPIAAQTSQFPMSADVALTEVGGLDQVLDLGPRFVLFGELHGTNEAPRFFADVVIALASQGKHVLVAVELSAPEDVAMQRAWAAAPEEFARALTGPDWTLRRDGVTSGAMRDMLVRLQQYKASGAAVSIVAFNGYRDDAQRLRLQSLGPAGGHEVAQAENIADAARRADADITLVLVGNAHAEKTPISRDGMSYDPMAMTLAKSGRLVSLNMLYAGGTAWNCQLKADLKFDPAVPITTAMLDCANHPVTGLQGKDDAPYIALGPVQGANFDGRYDGYFWLGAISGSVPALP